MSTATEQPVENNMTYVRLGKSGLKVSSLILGCASYGTSKWYDWIMDEEEGMTHIKAAYDLGINTFDTADVYSNGLSEVVLGKAIKKYNLPRDEIVIMTKFHGTVQRDPYAQGILWAPDAEKDKMRYANQCGNGRKHIFAAIKKSLERLQLDYVDLYQCHRFDVNTPIEETMQALHDVVKAGYARYIGMSSCAAWQFHKMQNYARANGLTEFISMQNYHNSIYREEEREMTPLLQDMGVGMIPWSPLARGFLTRPAEATTFRNDNDPFYRRSNADPQKDPASIAINQRIAAVAEKRGISMAQVAIAWSLSKPFVTAPVFGTTSIEKLKDLCGTFSFPVKRAQLTRIVFLGGVHVKLTEEEVKSIDEPYEPKPILM